MTNEKIRSQEKALRMANATETAKNGIDAGAGAGADAAEDAPIKSEHPWRSKQVQGVQAQGEASGREGGRGGSAVSEVKEPAGFISRIKTSSQVASIPHILNPGTLITLILPPTTASDPCVLVHLETQSVDS
jgi:hypothetical protein